jgi:hypothetical protein
LVDRTQRTSPRPEMTSSLTTVPRMRALYATIGSSGSGPRMARARS